MSNHKVFRMFRNSYFVCSLLAVLVAVLVPENASAAQTHLDLNRPELATNLTMPARATPVLKRHKRYLLWAGGGISKVSVFMRVMRFAFRP